MLTIKGIDVAVHMFVVKHEGILGPKGMSLTNTFVGDPIDSLQSVGVRIDIELGSGILEADDDVPLV
jgi:hypothetical protein